MYEVAQKFILLELKSKIDQQLIIDEISYSKNDLISSFDFFYKDENWDLIMMNTKYPFIRSFENISELSFYLSLPISFQEDENNFKIRKYLTDNHIDGFKKELRNLLNKNDFDNLRILISYCKLLTDESEYEIYEIIKRQIELKYRELELVKFKLSKDAQFHYSLRKSFVDVVKIAGNDDPNFIVDCLNFALQIRNFNQKIMQSSYISCLKEHLNLSHTDENLDFIKSIIKQRDKSNSFESNNYSGVAIAIFIIIRLILFFSRQ